MKSLPKIITYTVHDTTIQGSGIGVWVAGWTLACKSPVSTVPKSLINFCLVWIKSRKLTSSTKSNSSSGTTYGVIEHQCTLYLMFVYS